MICRPYAECMWRELRWARTDKKKRGSGDSHFSVHSMWPLWRLVQLQSDVSGVMFQSDRLIFCHFLLCNAPYDFATFHLKMPSSWRCQISFDFRWPHYLQPTRRNRSASRYAHALERRTECVGAGIYLLARPSVLRLTFLPFAAIQFCHQNLIRFAMKWTGSCCTRLRLVECNKTVICAPHQARSRITLHRIYRTHGIRLVIFKIAYDSDLELIHWERMVTEPQRKLP